MTRALTILLALLFPAVAWAQCNPTNAPPYSAGCEPVVSSYSTTDTLSIWQPAAFPGSANQIQIGTIQAGIVTTALVTASGTGITNTLPVWMSYLSGGTNPNPVVFGGNVSGAGITSLFASPPPIGGTVPAAGSFTVLAMTSSASANSGVFTGPQMNEYNTFLLNGIVPLTEWQHEQASTYSTDMVTSGIAVPSSSTKHGTNPFACYLTNASTTTEPVCYYASVRATANNTEEWSYNDVLDDSGFTGVTIQHECDVNSNIAGTIASCLDAVGSFGTTNHPGANVIAAQVTGAGQWGSIVSSESGATTTAISLGAIAASGTNVVSQNIAQYALDASGTLRSCVMQANPLTAGANYVLDCATGNVLLGHSVALSLSSTTGFPLIATAPGIPTGVVGAAGQAAIMINTSSHKICHSEGGGTWYDATGAACS